MLNYKQIMIIAHANKHNLKREAQCCAIRFCPIDCNNLILGRYKVYQYKIRIYSYYVKKTNVVKYLCWPLAVCESVESYLTINPNINAKTS